MSAVWSPLASAVSPLWALTNAVARVALSPRAHRLRCPVISVGNVVAGGVGKTEVAAAVAARLAARGKRVVVASRGYGSRWESQGGVAHDAETAASLRFPDEAIVVLKKAPGVSVVVGADRRGLLERHWEELRPDVVILDDGLQHFPLARDLDIVVHDFGARWPILRDLPGVLSRASVRVALSDVPPRWLRGKPWVRARYKITGAVDAHGRRSPLPPKALAFCGLGNPDRFRKSLEAAGTRLGGPGLARGFRSYADHYEYAERDARALADWSDRAKLPLLTTLKDFVKLVPFVGSQGGVSAFEPSWVEIALEVTDNENLLWSAVDGALGARS